MTSSRSTRRIALALAILTLCAGSRGLAAEILSVDDSALPADGPMVATARVRKALKGPLVAGTRFRFSETAWVGPAYRKGERRILFLERAARTESPRPAPWRIVSRLDARRDYFFEKDALARLTAESLESFLERIDRAVEKPRKVVFERGAVR
jgi:hypothetical protein